MLSFSSERFVTTGGAVMADVGEKCVSRMDIIADSKADLTKVKEYYDNWVETYTKVSYTPLLTVICTVTFVV